MNMPENNQIILVEILNGTPIPSGGCAGCGGGCSTGSCGSIDVNYNDATNLLAEALEKAFGDTVSVRYVNVDETGIDQYPILNKVLTMGYPYPITLINGAPKFAGAIMNDEIKAAIEEIKNK
jgi:hypothetical protein